MDEGLWSTFKTSFVLLQIFRRETGGSGRWLGSMLNPGLLSLNSKSPLPEPLVAMGLPFGTPTNHSKRALCLVPVTILMDWALCLIRIQTAIAGFVFLIQLQYPYIMAMIGDGKTTYNHDRDGLEQEVGGCQLDFRNKNNPTKAKVTYKRFRSLKVMYCNRSLS
jgi:hypothetical protein